MKYLTLIIVLLLQLPLKGQSSGNQTDASESLIYDHELSVGVNANTSGMALFVDYSKAMDMNTKRLYRFEIAGINHPKEYKQSNDYVIGPVGYSPKPYVFGKQNSLIALHVSRGKKILLGDKAEKSGVEVNMIYLYGISLGLVKPYYLDLIYILDGINAQIISEKYSDSNKDHFLSPQYISGSSSFTNGLNEIKLYPGLHAELGVNFDWANYSDFVKSLEIGIRSDLFYKKVPIMLTESNQALYAALYFSIEFGKKW